MIVVEGLKGRPVSEICIEHQINQGQYYQWQDHFLANMPRVFADDNRREKALTKEDARLKRIVGDLAVEFKKTEEWLR